MIKLMMIFTDFFEDTEAITTLDVLKRGNIKVEKVSLMKRYDITSKCNVIIKCDKLYEDINLSDYDGVIIPGGPGSFKIMPNLKEVDDIINYYANHNKLVSAICAAPHLVGRLGYLKNKEFTIHPGFENEVIDGIYKRDKGVCATENFITAKSMYYSFEFGLAIYNYFYNDGSKEKLKLSCMGE